MIRGMRKARISRSFVRSDGYGLCPVVVIGTEVPLPIGVFVWMVDSLLSSGVKKKS
jgi:hypothetical protein